MEQKSRLAGAELSGTKTKSDKPALGGILK